MSPRSVEFMEQARERLVAAREAFDDALYALAQRAQTAREGADYEAETPR